MGENKSSTWDGVMKRLPSGVMGNATAIGERKMVIYTHREMRHSGISMTLKIRTLATAQQSNQERYHLVYGRCGADPRLPLRLATTW